MLFRSRVDMGAPILKSADVPVNSDNEKVISEKITVAGREFNMTCVSMGNPHAVMFIEEHPSDFDLDFYGAKFECNTDIFPNRINAEFAKVIDRKNIEMRVFERGTGETLACGTGACAAAVSCILNGLTEDKVTVKLLGGDLEIEWDREENLVYMTGPAVTVYDGEINIEGITA